MSYHSIILSGTRHESSGRGIGGYRLRTAAEKFGYSSLVIDSALSMTSDELESVLENNITDKTLMLGISTVWLNAPDHPNIKPDWINKEFFDRIKSKYLKLKIVAGGVGLLKLEGSKEIYDASHWHVTGFSDDSYPRLLMFLDGKSGHKLKYFVDSNGRRTIDSNRAHQIQNPNDIETVLIKDDNFLSHQPIPLEVSRGCIFRCVFCNHPFQGAKDYDSYMRTPENIAIELKRNYDLFGTTRYSLMDDTFNDSYEKLDRLERAIELAKIPNFEFQCYLKPELLVTKPKMINQLTRIGLVGGFAGIESLNDRARKEMNKGMNVKRVLDSLQNLMSINNKAKLTAGLIVGLPGDTYDDIYKWQDFFIETQDSLFKSWKYSVLGIYTMSVNEQDNTNLSPIEKNPEKYGYTILKSNPGNYAHWQNEHMNLKEAFQFSKKLNLDTNNIAKVGGWTVSSCWHLNESEENMSIKTLNELNITERLAIQARKRAVEIVNKLTQ
jgi:hypothetical protein